MKEISYQIFDKESGLPIENMGDSYVRDLAASLDKSSSEIFGMLKSQIEEMGVKYMIPLGVENVVAISEDFFSPFLTNYYGKYEDALTAIRVS